MLARKKANLKIIKYDGSFFFVCAKPNTILLRNEFKNGHFFFFRESGGFTSFLKGWNGAGWVCKSAKMGMIE